MGADAQAEGVYTTDSGVLSLSHFPAGGNADSASTVGESLTFPPTLPAVGDRFSLNLFRNEYKNPILRKRLEVLEIDYPFQASHQG